MRTVGDLVAALSSTDSDLIECTLDDALAVLAELVSGLALLATAHEAVVGPAERDIVTTLAVDFPLVGSADNNTDTVSIVSVSRYAFSAYTFSVAVCQTVVNSSTAVPVDESELVPSAFGDTFTSIIKLEAYAAFGAGTVVTVQGAVVKNGTATYRIIDCYPHFGAVVLSQNYVITTWGIVYCRFNSIDYHARIKFRED